MVPVRALIYSRVSTDAQERDGTSLDTQERACREYAQAKGWVGQGIGKYMRSKEEELFLKA